MRRVSAPPCPAGPIFQSTHPLRGATDLREHRAAHAVISIHAPLAGCDQHGGHGGCPQLIFQSTHPLRGATTMLHTEVAKLIEFQSTHPLRGATTVVPCGDLVLTFQSTHPLRGATDLFHPIPHTGGISIHAPLAGCDVWRAWGKSRCCYFNPRTPCGVRPEKDLQEVAAALFQSTHPLRGATCAYYDPKDAVFVFQSTHPLRGATLASGGASRCFNISIHAPLAGCDNRRRGRAARPRYFNPRTPCGVRLAPSASPT